MFPLLAVPLVRSQSQAPEAATQSASCVEPCSLVAHVVGQGNVCLAEPDLPHSPENRSSRSPLHEPRAGALGEQLTTTLHFDSRWWEATLPNSHSLYTAE